MMRTTLRRVGRSAVVLPLLLFGAACGALDVSDPTAIEDDDLDNAEGAQLLRCDALRAFAYAVGRGAVVGGQLGDEFFFNWFAPLPFGWDQRNMPPEEGPLPYQEHHEVRRAAAVALPRLLTYGTAAQVGEMFAVRGYATLHLAENFCPGFPVNELVDFKLVYGTPLTTEQAFERAIADFDTALTHAVEDVQVLDFARVGRAAALLGLGRFTDAASAAAPVPTDYTWNAQYVGDGSDAGNPLYFVADEFSPAFLSVADGEGGNGLDFRTAGDPRVETVPLGPGLDGVTEMYRPAKYADAGAPMVVASGIEARLIEAEAALSTDPGSGGWLSILNALRTDGTQDGAGVFNPGTGGVAGLAPLADPVAAQARVDLLFRERAFWLFATGRRLADLRRLTRLYGRAPETVFPTGPYYAGGVYGTATSISFPAFAEAPFNPAVTGCTAQ